MAIQTKDRVTQRSLNLLTGTVVAACFVGALYWMQEVLVPIALAIYFAFILNPVVRASEKAGLGRVPAVLLVVFLVSLLLGGIGFLLSRQFTALSQELPNYRTTIMERVRTIRDLGRPGRLGKLADDVAKEFNSPKGDVPAKSPRGSTLVPPDTPVPVVDQSKQPVWSSHLLGWIGQTASSAMMILLAMIFVVFLLIDREDFRNRFLWLAGRRTLTSTTKAMEDAAERVGKFLSTQALLNGSFGIILGAGLYLLGIKYALLWGFLGGILRYLPYIGPWLGAIFPILLSVAMAESWGQPLAVIAFVVLLELINNNAVEPYLYGRSIGASALALLIGAVFWTWLWGPIGLILSPPLTVILVVLGEHVPQLRFLAVLLGDHPSLAPETTYYQRLLARDQDEAISIILGRMREKNPDQIYDEFLIPALGLTRIARERNELAEDDEQFIWQATDEILDNLEEASPSLSDNTSPDNAVSDAPPPVRLLCCAAQNEADRLALRMLQQLLPISAWGVRIISGERLFGEVLEQVNEDVPSVICVASVSQGGLARTRYLCKRLRVERPQTKILVGRWTPRKTQTELQELLDAGADYASTTLLETVTQLQALHPVLTQQQRREVAAIES